MGHKGKFLVDGLNGLRLGSADLTPTFDPNVTSYSANITTATTTLTLNLSSGATAVTKLNGTAFTGSTVTWTENTDTLTIEVTNSVGVVKTYTVTVTHTS